MLEERLRAIAFLRDLPTDTLQKAAGCLQVVRYERDSVIFAAGDTADSLYLVESGQLEVSEPESDRVLASLGPGSVVGELGVLLDAPRAATVRTLTDVELWRLSREDVEAMVRADASLAVALSREIGRRLIAANRAVELPPPRLVVAPTHDVAALARALVEEGVDGICTLELGEAIGEFPDGVGAMPPSELDAESVVALAATPVEGRAMVLVALPREPTPAAEAAADAADFAVAIGRPLPRYVVERVPALRQLSGAKPASQGRLARWVSGRSIGLALSSGGTKTAAHVGVVRVLRSLGITIDAVAGSSGGSVVAASVASDADDRLIEARTRQMQSAFRFFKLGPKIPPWNAVFSGRGPHALFRTWHGDDEIADCPIPLFLVAADLATGAEVIIDKGRIADAIRASISIPGVLEACRWNGRFLVDGGIVSPLPARVLRDAGIRWVIGSNVAGQEPSSTNGARAPHLVETMTRMVSTMERQMLSGQVSMTDVHIRPVVRAANSFDFGSIDAFIAEGERAAREQLPALEHLTKVAAHG